MDATARQYVTELKAAKNDEAARAEVRRAKRNNHLVRQEHDRVAEARNALRLRVQQRIRDPQSAVMEQSLFDTIRRTAAWWDAICANAVERKVHMERAGHNGVRNRADYLRSVKSQECQEQANVMETDAQRWQKAKEAFALREEEWKVTTIQDVVATLLGNVDSCADFLDKYAIADSKSSVLAQFGLSEVIRRSYLSHAAAEQTDSEVGSCLRSTDEAFKAFFRECNPFRTSTPYLPSLLHALLRNAKMEGFSQRPSSATFAGKEKPVSAQKLIFDVSRVPVFAVSGAKFSGKSILTEHLVSKYGFRSFSERDLVARAMHVYQDSKKEQQEVDSDEAGAPATLQSEWCALGETIESRLLNGGAVSPSVMAALVALQLQEVQADLSVKGVVLDGVFTSAETFQRAQETVLPDATDSPLRAFMEAWCGAECPTQEADDDGNLAAAWLPPPAPPAEEQPVKKESKARASKKPIDMNSLPPPVLPVVDDVSAEVNRERAFVKQASEELASGYGSLVSAFFYIDCPPEEIFKRYAGLRVDKETGEEYHMVFHPPPEDRLAFLVNRDRTAVNTAQLASIVFSQQKGWESMRRWLRERPSASASMVVELDGSAPAEESDKETDAAVEQALQNFAKGLALREAMKTSQERIRQLEAACVAQEAARESERLRLVGLYNEKGVSPLPEELLVQPRSWRAGPRSSEAAAAASEEADAKVQAEQPEQPEQPATTSIAELCDVVPHGIPAVVFPSMIALTETYKTTYRKAWETISDAANLLLGYRVASQTYIHRYWESTPDGKQTILDRFVSHFNTVPRHLRSCNACKDELHGVVDELRTALFGSVAARKRECSSLIETTMRCETFLSSWDASMCSIGVLLTQLEAVRFTTIANLVMFYFSTLLGEPVPLDELDVVNGHPASSTGVDCSEGHNPALSAVASTIAGTGSSGTAAGSKRVGATYKKTSGVAPHAPSGGVVGAGDVALLDFATSSERATQEALQEAVQRIETMLNGFVERLRSSTRNAASKGDKKSGATAISTASLPLAATTSPAKLVAMISKCLPIIESELTKTQERIAMVHGYMVELLQQGESYRLSVRSELHAEATEVLKKEAAAVNTALYVLRCRVEEERLAPRMHLGCGTFDILSEYGEVAPRTDAKGSRSSTLVGRRDPRQPSFLTDVPLHQELAARGIKVHATLSAARLFDLIDTFACIAPNYQLARDDFILTVIEDDYAGATVIGGTAPNDRKTRAKGRREGSAGGTPTSLIELLGGSSPHQGGSGSSPPPVDGLKTVADVFRSFDTHDCGFIDWREFVMHLLFWCAPPPRPSTTVKPQRTDSTRDSPAFSPSPSNSASEGVFYIPEASIEQLLDAKYDVGLEPLSEDVFRTLPFFFDEHLSDERRDVVAEALWRTFRDTATGTVDTYALFFFLCCDLQPIRGAQKAFYVLSSLAQETGGVTRAEMERIFHTHATNPRNLGKYDPFSRQNQNLLFETEADADGVPTVLTFQDMCGCLIGRRILNSLDVFRRKRFVFAELS